MNDWSVRQNEIVTLARSAGRVAVDDLARRYDVSPQTIRKDLNELCDRHLLSRVHGGAIIATGVENIAYEARRLVAASEKRAIGVAAAALIPNNSSLFIKRPERTSAFLYVAVTPCAMRLARLFIRRQRSQRSYRSAPSFAD